MMEKAASAQMGSKGGEDKVLDGLSEAFKIGGNTNLENMWLINWLLIVRSLFLQKDFQKRTWEIDFLSFLKFELIGIVFLDESENFAYVFLIICDVYIVEVLNKQ